jgi:HEAT repeat protein
VNEQATYLGKGIMEWVHTLEHSDPLRRRLAAYALGEIGLQAQAAVPALRGALQDPVNWVRVWAAAAFAKVTEDRSAVALLVAEMHAPQAFVRSLVAWHLGRLGANFPGIEAGIDALQQLLEDDDPSVQVEAGVALQTLQSKGSLPSGTAFLSAHKWQGLALQPHSPDFLRY